MLLCDQFGRAFVPHPHQLRPQPCPLKSREEFRDAPADGFYEWKGPKRARTPVWFHERAQGLLFFAGLYEEWRPHDGQSETIFTILTCQPNAVTRPVHNPMPVILPHAKSQEDWINPYEPSPLSLKRLLVPASDDLLLSRAASSLVNNLGNDGPALLMPTGAGETFDLFAKPTNSR